MTDPSTDWRDEIVANELRQGLRVLDDEGNPPATREVRAWIESALAILERPRDV